MTHENSHTNPDNMDSGFATGSNQKKKKKGRKKEKCYSDKEGVNT